MNLFLKIFIIPVLFMFLIDLYAFQAVRTICQSMADGHRRWIYTTYWVVFGLAAATLLLNYFYSFHFWPKALRTYGIAVIFTLYISKLLILPVLLIDDIGRVVRYAISYFTGPKGSSAHTGTPITRSQFLSQAALILAAIPAVSLTYGMVFGAFDFKVRRKKLKFAKLPKAFDGLKVLQISDLHTGTFVSTDPLERAVKIINQQEADIIFFTGDLVNDKTDEVYPFIHTLKKVKAKIGVYSCLGNHDYGNYYGHWKNEEEKQQSMLDLYQVHRDLGWDLLRNENRILKKGDASIAIAGVENWGASNHFPKYGDLNKALTGLDNTPFTLLLSHDPSHWDAQIRQHPHKVDITFAGHTHGMQFGIDTKVIKWSPVQYFYKQWAGLYSNKERHLYVNRGLGCLGYPGRAGIRPEITVLELYSA